MAIAFSLPTIGRKIQPEETGIPDYISALSKGLDLGYKPRNLENEAYGKELANKINEAKAKYAMDQELANLQNTRSGTSLNATNVQRILQDISQKKYAMQQEKMLRDLLSGNANNGPIQNNSQNENGDQFAAPQPTQQPSYSGDNIKNGQKDSMNTNQEQVISAGNPNLQHINNIYENYPQYRKKLENMGFKLKETVKFDPRTGIASIIKQLPNGEVRVTSSHNTGSQIPLTNDMKTRLQKMIQFAPAVIEKLEDLKNTYSPAKLVLFPQWKADKRQNYERKVRELAESFAVTKGWPNVKGAIDKAEKILMRGDWESTEGYQNSLDGIIKEVREAEENARHTLDPSYIPKMGEMKNNVLEAPNVPKNIHTKEQFQRWLKSLPKNQQVALKRKHFGTR